MTSWQGHHAVTTEALVRLLERAELDGEAFSPRERALFVTSEFWAAVASLTLDEYLKQDALEKLRQAAAAFLLLHELKVAELVQQTLHEHAATTRLPRANVDSLQREILYAARDMDEKLAKFAMRGNSRERSPGENSQSR